MEVAEAGAGGWAGGGVGTAGGGGVIGFLTTG